MRGSSIQQSIRLLATAATLTAIWIGALSASAAAGPQLVMFEQDGCSWCEKWNREVGAVYLKTPEGKLAPLRRLDIHKPLPRELKFLAKGGYTPTFVLVDRGREIGRIRGYPGEDFFWGFLGKMLLSLPASSRQTKMHN